MKQEMAHAKRVLLYGLATLWCIDAGLQAQPGMFHKAFYGKLPNSLMPSSLQTIHESAAPFIAPFVEFTEHVYALSPYVVNSLVILLQLALGILLFVVKSQRVRRSVLIGSTIWALCVWLFGEGLSGLFAFGSMNYYAGFPGSALLYAFASVILMASDESWESGKVYAWVRRSISILFLVCAVLQVIPEDGNWQQATQMSLFGNSGFQPQPKMFSHPVMWLTDWIFNGDHAVVVNFLETALLLYASAIAWWWKNWSAWFRGFVYVWLFFTWWFGMDFGYLFSGLSTDLNTAPVVFLILWSQSPRFHMEQKTTSNG